MPIYLRNRLVGRPDDPDALCRVIRATGEVVRFHDPAPPYLHPEHVEIALDVKSLRLRRLGSDREWPACSPYRAAAGDYEDHQGAFARPESKPAGIEQQFVLACLIRRGCPTIARKKR